MRSLLKALRGVYLITNGVKVLAYKGLSYKYLIYKIVYIYITLN